MDIAHLGIQIDSQSARSGASDLRSLATSGGQAEASIVRLERSASAAASGVQALVNRSTGLDRAFSSASSSTQDWVSKLNAQAKSFDQVRASVDPVFAASQKYQAVVEQVNSAVQAGISSEQEANRVRELAASSYLGVATAAERAAKEQRELEQAQREADQAADAAAKAYMNMRGSIDPLYAASKRYEMAVESVNEALQRNVISQAEANRALDLAEQQYLSIGDAANRASGRFGGLSSGFQNASYQIQDMAVQFEMGTDPIRIMSQQLPQLASGVAMVGGGAGIAIAAGSALFAVLAPLVGKLFEMENAGDVAEDAFESLGEAMSTVASFQDILDASTKELSETYGENADAVRENIRLLSELSQAQAVTALQDAVRSVSDTVSGVVMEFAQIEGQTGRMARNIGTQIAALEAQTGMTAVQARAVRDAFAEMGEAEGLSQSTAAAQQLSDTLLKVFGSAEDIPPELQSAAQRAIEAANSGYELEAALDESASSAYTAADGASALANQLSIAQQYAANLALSMGALPSGVVNLQNQAKVVKAQIEAIDAGYGKITADAIAYRAELEKQYGLQDAGSAAEEAYINSVIHRQVEEWKNVQKLNEAYREKVTALNKVGGAAGSAGGSAKEAAKEFEKLAKDVERLNEAADPLGKFNKELAKLEALKDFGLSEGAFSNEIARLNDELASSLPLVDDLDQSFRDFLKSGMKDISSLRDMFESAIIDMIATAARNQIFIPIVASITGGATAVGSPVASIGNSIAGSVTNNLLGGGLLGGITSGLTSGLSGIFSGGGLGASFANLGGLLTGSVGGLGAIGAAIPAIGLVAAGISFFTTKTKQLDSGLRLTVDGMDTLAESFEKIQKSRFWGLSKKISYSYSELGEDGEAIVQAVSGIQQGVIDAASALGFASSAFDDFAMSLQISTKGMSDDEITAAIQENIVAIADGMADMLLASTDFVQSGETSAEALSRLSTSLTTANSAFDTLGHTLFTVGLTGADLASSLMDAFGGTEAFTTATTAYYQAVYSESERLAVLTRQTTDALGDLGLAMPASRAQYREMVEALDLSTASGQDAYAMLVSLASAFDQILPSVATFTDLIAGLIGSTSTSVDTMISEANTMARSAERAASDWSRTATTLRSFISQLTNSNTSSLSLAQQQAQNSALLKSTYEAARGGDIDAARNFASVAKDYLATSSQTAKTASEFAVIEGRVRAQAKFLAGLSELEEASKTVEQTLYEQQIGVLEQLSEYLATDAVTESGLADFTDQISALEASLAAVEMVNYDFLKERLNVTVGVLADASIPDHMRVLLANAEAGINSTIDFAVIADDLTPEMRWLALQSASEHVKTLEFLEDTSAVSEAVMGLALARSSDLARTVRLVAGSGVGTDLQRLALTGASEISRVVNVSLSSGANDQAIQLALGALGVYEVSVRAALDASVSDEVRQIVFSDAQTYAVSVEAAMAEDMADWARALLLGRQQRLTVNVAATLASGVSGEMAELLLEANTAAMRGITVAMVYGDTVTAAQRQLLEDNAMTALRTIEAVVNPIGWTADGVLFLRALSEYADAEVKRAVSGSVTVSGSASAMALLDHPTWQNVTRRMLGEAWMKTAFTTDDGLTLLNHDNWQNVTRRMLGEAWMKDGLTSADGLALLNHAYTENVFRNLVGGAWVQAGFASADGIALLQHGTNEQVFRSLRGSAWLETYSQLGLDLLAHGDAESVQRTLFGRAWIETASQTGLDLLSHDDRETVFRNLVGGAWIGTSSADGLALLNHDDKQTVFRNLQGGAWVGTSSADGLALLNLADKTTIFRNLIGGAWLQTYSADGLTLLRHDNWQNVQRRMLGEAYLRPGASTADGIALLNHDNWQNVQRRLLGGAWMEANKTSGDGLRLLNMTSDTISRILKGQVDLSALNGKQTAFMDAITGASSGTIRLGGGVTFDPGAAFNDALESSVATPMSALQGSLWDLRQAILDDKASREAATEAARVAQEAANAQAAAKAATEQAFNTYASRLGNDDGTLIASEAQLMALAQAGGLSTSGSLVDIGARVAGFSGSDNINAVVAGGAAIYDYLFGVFKSQYVPTTSEKYNAAYGLSAKHYDSSGRDEILSGARQFKPLAFDWAAVGINIPGFASGGHHLGGLRMVGENGPELEVTGPSRIYSNSDTTAMLDNRPVVEELRKLRLSLDAAEKRSERADREMVKATKEIASLQRKFDAVGIKEAS